MPLRVFLTGRQVPVLVALLAASGVLIWFGGGLNMPLPGARVPIVLGSLAPLICACLCLSGLDAAGLAWAERVTSRDLGAARAVLLSGLLLITAGIVLVSGSHSLGVAVAGSLVRGVGLLLGPAAVAWLLGGQGAGVAVATVLTVAFASFGGRGAAPGEVWARWAVLFAEPGDAFAGALGTGGFVMAVATAWSRDALHDRRTAQAARRAAGRTTGPRAAPAADEQPPTAQRRET